MYLLTFISLLVLSSAFNCPISPQKQYKIFSGVLKAEPDAGVSSQDMKFTNNYQTALSQIPQVSLSIYAYEDQNQGTMKIILNKQNITQEGFVIRVSSPPNSNWKVLGINYIVSTKPEIQMGIISAINPVYNNNGFIQLQYTPTIKITSNLKIRQFIVGVNIQAESGGILAIRFENIQIKQQKLIFLFSSLKTQIYGIVVSVILFDKNTPGLLFVDGSINQNSLQTPAQVQIQHAQIQNLKISIVGFNSINAKDANGLRFLVSFNQNFSLVFDSARIQFIQAQYLAISFTQCGNCKGYPYSYSGSCYASCPGNIIKNGECIQIQLDCGPNSYYNKTDNICYCVDGYVFQNNKCQKCPQNLRYSPTTKKCENPCPAGKSYDFIQNICTCTKDQQWNGLQCVCARNCPSKQCPPGTYYFQNQGCLRKCRSKNAIYINRGCYCTKGYQQVNGQCIQIRCASYQRWNQALKKCQSSCRGGQIFDGNHCICQNGFVIINGRCQALCGINQRFVNNRCECQPGYFQRNGFCTKN